MTAATPSTCGICTCSLDDTGRCRGCGREAGEGAIPLDALARDAVGTRVLVASPHDNIAADVAARLRERGLAPVCVHSGARAVAAFSPELPEQPSAAILDVTLADLVVPTLISHLREDLGLRDVPIILLAAVHNSARYRRKPGRLYGANAAMEYPGDVEAVVGELERLLDGDPGARVRDMQGLDAFGAGQLARRLLADVALFHASDPLIPDGVPLDVGLREAQVEGARAYAGRAGGSLASEAFEQELRSLQARLASGPAAGLEAP